MKKILRQIWEDIKRGENIDLLATIGLVVVIAILDILDLASPDLVSSVTLTTLGLIAIGLLVTRYKMDMINHRYDNANTVQLSKKMLDTLESDLKDENVKEIWMLGLVLRGTIYRHFHSFNQNVANGTRFRAIIADWNKIDMNTTVKRLARGVTLDSFQAGYKEAVERLKEIHQSAKNRDGVQLRLLDFVPPFSLYLFPKAKDGGIIYVEIYCYKSRDGSIPKFLVREQENPIWYKHFLEQFELMWRDSKEFTF